MQARLLGWCIQLRIVINSTKFITQTRFSRYNIIRSMDLIIDDFGHYYRRIHGQSDEDDQFDETLLRMIVHFEQQLASLLYETEKDNLPHHHPSLIYGGEHLLRMLDREPDVANDVANKDGEPDVANEDGEPDVANDVANEDGEPDVANDVANEDGEPDVANENHEADSAIWDEVFGVWVAMPPE